MEIRRLEPQEGMLPNPSFLQSDFWASFKANSGWKPYRFSLEIAGGKPGREALGLSVLLRRLPLGLSFAYVPHGPSIGPFGDPSSGEGLCLDYKQNTASQDWGADPASSLSKHLGDIAMALKPHLPQSCVFIRFDLPQYSLSASPPSLLPPLKKAAVDIQPPDTVVIDLLPSEEDILAAMKPKWRYNVKLAEKKRLELVCVDAQDSSEGEIDAAIDDFFALYQETSERDKIALHSKAYYRGLFAQAHGNANAPRLRAYFARYEGSSIASIITLFGKGEAVYLYGASSNRGRNLMPAYALQWRAMRDAKASGCVSYDLFGIPPSDDPQHPMHGLYRFKTGFGGRILHRLGCYDLALRPLAYALFSGAERLRYFYFKRIAKLGKRGSAQEEPQSDSPKTSASKT